MNFSRKLILRGVLLTLAIAAPAAAQTVVNDDTVLKQVIIFGRHGVRSSTMSQANYAVYSPRPYPDFGVPVGYLTEHGRQAEVLLGSYYRGYLLSEGLLTGDTNTDLAHSYFRANSIQRSNITAAALGAGLFPGATVPVHSFALNTPDPVFDPILTNVANVNPNRAATEVQAIFNSGTALASAYSAEFSLVRSVLYNYQNGTQSPPATPAGYTDPTAQSIPLSPVTGLLYTGNVVDIGGLLSTENAADPFIMEYTAGLPLADVGWGQMPVSAISQYTRLATVFLNIVMATPYLAQVQSSNAASHILRTMRQAVLGQNIPGAFGDAGSKVVVVISSDAYVAGLAGLLKTHWQLNGYEPDFCAPGGALVFELRQSMSSGEYLVRAFYTAQSLDQLRNLTPLSQLSPPLTAQLLIPGGSRPGASFDIRFQTFEKLLTSAIGPQYVQDPAKETPPTVLTGVPLQ